MSFKKPYLAIALLGVAAASGAAWWLQNKPTQPTEMVATPAGSAGAGATPAGAPAASGAAGSPGAPGAGGPARPMAVEVAKVEKAMLVDETQSVGSLKSNQGVVLRPEVGGASQPGAVQRWSARQKRSVVGSIRRPIASCPSDAGDS